MSWRRLNSPTAPRRLRARAREAEVLRLRAEGWTFEEIGAAIGITKQSAHEAFWRVMYRRPEDLPPGVGAFCPCCGAPERWWLRPETAALRTALRDHAARLSRMPLRGEGEPRARRGVRVRMLETAELEAADPHLPPVRYAPGRVYELPPDEAEHLVDSGLARELPPRGRR